MFRTLLVAGIAAFVGKKLYDKGTLDPYIKAFRERMDSLETSLAENVIPESDRSTPDFEMPKSFKPAPQTQPTPG